MKKKFLILFTALFLTGCSVDYNLVITDKRIVKENFEVTVNNSKMTENYSSVDEYLDYFSNMYKEMPGNEKYTIKTKKGTSFSSFIVSNQYANLNDYVESRSFNSMFDDAAITDVGSYVTFKTTKNVYLEMLNADYIIDENYYYDEFKINIKFYNNVVDHNADSVDASNNVYTWVVTSSNPKDYVYFKIDGKKRYDIIIKDIIQTHFIEFLVVGGVVVVAIIGGLYFTIKIKRSNKI